MLLLLNFVMTLVIAPITISRDQPIFDPLIIPPLNGTSYPTGDGAATDTVASAHASDFAGFWHIG